MSQQPVKLMDLVRQCMRTKQYSMRTEKAYVSWIKRFIIFHNKTHPIDMGEKEINAFLVHLAVNRRVAASTQNQALNALLFLYKYVLGMDLSGHFDSKRAKLPQRLPVVLSEQDVFSLIESMTGTPKLIAELLYCTGMRGLECLKLRVKDIDFTNDKIRIQNESTLKNRTVRIPSVVRSRLMAQLKYVKRRYEKDLRNGLGTVCSFTESEGAYLNYAERELPWQYVFPSNKLSVDPQSGKMQRPHFHMNSLNHAIRKAADVAGLNNQASSYVFRHSLAVHLLEDGCNIRSVQELLGHQNIKNTLVYAQFVDRKVQDVRSPLEKLYGSEVLQN